MIDTLFTDYLDRTLDLFINPQKRVFLGYLVSAFFISVFFLVLTRRTSLLATVKHLLSKRVWWSISSRADYKIFLINQVIMMGLAPRLIGKLAVATVLFESLHIWFDGRVLIWSDAPPWAIAMMFTTCVFVLDDFTKYWLHRVLHSWAILWPFHKVHHTAQTLTPLTVQRTHPVEAVLFALRSTMVHATCVAAFLFFFGDKATLVTVLGANAFLFAFNALGSNLRHSHVWLRYGRTVEHVLISPAQHQIHHSVEARHYDSNYGAVLAVWDWMFGSLIVAERKKTFQLGVNPELTEKHDLKTLYLTPFAEAASVLTHPVRKTSAELQPKTKTG